MGKFYFVYFLSFFNIINSFSTEEKEGEICIVCYDEKKKVKKYADFFGCKCQDLICSECYLRILYTTLQNTEYKKKGKNIIFNLGAQTSNINILKKVLEENKEKIIRQCPICKHFTDDKNIEKHSSDRIFCECCYTLCEFF